MFYILFLYAFLNFYFFSHFIIKRMTNFEKKSISSTIIFHFYLFLHFTIINLNSHFNLNC